MADKLMVIPNDDTQNCPYCIGITIEQNGPSDENYPFCRLKLVVETLEPMNT